MVWILLLLRIVVLARLVGYIIETSLQVEVTTFQIDLEHYNLQGKEFN